MIVDPRDSSTVYAGGPPGVFKSNNGGESWTASNTGLTGLNAIGLSVDPFDSRHVFAWSPTQAFESSDAAATWTLRAGLRGDIIFDPSARDIVYANFFNDVQRSVDGGKTWSSMTNGLPRSHGRLAVGVDGTVYIGDAEGGVFVFDFLRRRAVR